MARTGDEWPESAMWLILRERRTAPSAAFRAGKAACTDLRLALLPRNYVGNFGLVRYLAAGGLGDVYAGVIEQQSRGTIKFDARLLVGSFGRDQIRFGSGQDRG